MSPHRAHRTRDRPPPSHGDVELHVTGDPDRGYTVTIQTLLAGAALDAMKKPWTQEDLSRWLVQLELGQVDRDALASIGKQFFLALFGSHVRDCYVEARGKAGAGLRLRLWFDPPELQALPWELLYDAGQHEFLALSGRTLVTRYLSVPRGTPPLAVTPPLRILVVTAAPKDRPSLDVDAEAAAVQAALAPLAAQGLVRVSTLPHAPIMALRDTLRDFQPHVLHFAGHGGVGPDGGALILEDENGLSHPLPGWTLGTMLKYTAVRLAVLNACLSARGTAVEARPFDEQRRALLGVGPALVEAGLGAVVAMQFSLSDEAARLFAHDFYATLARLEPVDLAVARAREALLLQAGLGSRDWATPVLFLRAPDGVIFAPSGRTPAPTRRCGATGTATASPGRPRVVRTVPADGETGVSCRLTTVCITFDRSMQTSTNLKCSSGGFGLTNGENAYNPDTFTFGFSRGNPGALPANTPFTFVVNPSPDDPQQEPSGFRDLTGNLAEPCEFSFTTGSDTRAAEPIVETGPNLRALRNQFNRRYDDDGLAVFCAQHLPEIYDTFDWGLPRQDKITLLLSYFCCSPERFAELQAVWEAEDRNSQSRPSP